MTKKLVINRLNAMFKISKFKYETDRKKRNNQIFLRIIYGIIAVLFLFYVTAYAFGLYKIGVGEYIPIFAYVISGFICLFFTILKSATELFAFKDYEFLSSLPIKSSKVLGSRIVVMYLLNSAFTILVMLPMMMIYGIFMKPEFLFYIRMIPGILLASLLPTVAAAIFGAVLTAISCRFKFYQAVQSALSIIFITVLMVGSLGLSGNKGNIFLENGKINQSVMVSLINNVFDNIINTMKPAYWFQKGIVDGSFSNFIAFVISSICIYSIFIYIFSKFYKKINTALNTYKAKGNFKIKNLKKHSVLGALYKKELKRYFGCSIYLTNTIMGAVLAIIFSFAMMFMGIEKMAVVFKMKQMSDSLVLAYPWIVWMFILMINTACSSLSLEGKQMWLIRSLPLHQREIYNSKLLVNYTISIPTCVITSIFITIALKPSFVMGVLYFITPVAMSLLVAIWGIYINQKFMDLEWESEIKVVKQNIASALGIFPFMFLAIILGTVNCIIKVNNILYLSLITICFIALAFCFYKKVCKVSIGDICK